MNAKLTAVMAVLTLCAGIALAQEGTGPKQHHPHGDFMGGMALPLHQLNLTDDQKAQVKQIFQAERTSMKPLMQQEQAAHMQLVQLITAEGPFDATKAASIVKQESETHMQLEVEHAKIASQVYQLLSSDQKAKVAELITQHQQRMQQRMQNHGQAASEQQ